MKDLEEEEKKRVVANFYPFLDLNYTCKFTRKELENFIGRMSRK